jgi:hypothetical protein
MRSIGGFWGQEEGPCAKEGMIRDKRNTDAMRGFIIRLEYYKAFWKILHLMGKMFYNYAMTFIYILFQIIFLLMRFLNSTQILFLFNEPSTHSFIYFVVQTLIN